MAKNVALDRALAKMQKKDKAAVAAMDPGEGATEEELAAARTSETDGDDEPEDDEGAPAEAPAPVEAPPVEAPPVEQPPAQADKPDDSARAQQRRDREAREAKQELARERAERARAERERDELKARLQAPPVDTTPKPPEDPEPEKPGPEPPREDIIEHDRWRTMRAEYRAWQSAQETRQLREQFQASLGQQNTAREQAEAVEQFASGMAIQERAFTEENPHYPAALKHLENFTRRRMLFEGIPEHQIDGRLRAGKVDLLVRWTDQGVKLGEPNPADYALRKLVEMSEICGFSPEAAAAPTARPAASPAAKIADQSKRAAASRTVSAMSATPVESQDSEQMTAERWIKMNDKQQRSWKKDHPEFSATDLLDDGSEDELNPILSGVRTLQQKGMRKRA